MLLSPMDVLSRVRSADRGRHELEVPQSQRQHYRDLLRQARLRPTRQRLLLAWMLFSKGNRHITAEMLYDEAIKVRSPMSLATIYNNLHQFTEAGLVQQIAIDGSKAFFDTNPLPHHHFFLVGEHRLLDIPASDVVVGNVPEAPPGYEITRVDVTVRLRRKPGASN